MVIALGVTSDGRKIPLKFIQTGAENERVCREMLEGLLERGLGIEPGLLCVIDGSKGLKKAIRGAIQREIERQTVKEKQTKEAA